MFSLIPYALAEESAQPGWFESAFDVSWGWPVMLALLAGGLAVFLWLRRKPGKPFWTVRTMSVGAMCMALSSVLSLIKLWTMPMGGAITPASMLPLLVFAYCYGAVPGVTLGALYGVMQFLLDGARFAALGAIPNLLDYPIAFGLLGLAGLTGRMKNQQAGLACGFLLGCFGRFLASFTSGYVYYGMYAPDGWNPAIYSIVYNGTYLLPECLICIALGLLIAPRLVSELRRMTPATAARA